MAGLTHPPSTPRLAKPRFETGFPISACTSSPACATDSARRPCRKVSQPAPERSRSTRLILPRPCLSADPEPQGGCRWCKSLVLILAEIHSYRAASKDEGLIVICPLVHALGAQKTGDLDRQFFGIAFGEAAHVRKQSVEEAGMRLTRRKI